MAAFKGVKLTGRDQSIPVYSLVNADAKTSGLRLSVDRYAGGVDLGGLGWSVRVVSGSDSDIGVLTPVVSYHWITFDWTFPQIVAAHEGLTVFQVAAVDAAKGMMWQSGKYTIMVTEALTESASYTEEELSLFQQAISNATVKLNAMSTQLDGFEARITTAVGTANAAAAAANSAAATATSAAADANTAASAANTAAAGAVEIKDTLEAKLAAGEFKGEKGDKGDTGGASEESIIAAGYTVKSIKAGGTAVTPVNGVANIPIASSSSAGVLKVIPNYGIIVSSGAAAINPATEYDIREKANEYKPIVPNRLDYAVKSALTWAKRTNYSDAEKATACDTIGAAAAADLSGHTGNTDIHVTADDKAGWNAKQDAIGDLDTIRSGAAAGATALQSVPVAGVGTFGLTKPYRDNTSYGISMDANGAFINGATADDIAARTNKYKPITPFTLDAAVKAALTDDSRDTGYSDDEKANARGVIGAASDGELSEAKAAITHLTPTEAPTVGKVLKVKSVNADGTFVCEWADGSDAPVKEVQVAGTALVPDANGAVNVPITGNDTAGVVKFYNYNPFYTDGNGRLQLYGAEQANINNRNTSRPIMPGTLNYALKAALTDSNRDTTYTDAQKTNACDTIGAERAKYDWTNYEYTITSSDVADGEPISYSMTVGTDMTEMWFAIVAKRTTTTSVVTGLSFTSNVSAYGLAAAISCGTNNTFVCKGVIRRVGNLWESNAKYVSLKDADDPSVYTMANDMSRVITTNEFKLNINLINTGKVNYILSTGIAEGSKFYWGWR